MLVAKVDGKWFVVRSIENGEPGLQAHLYLEAGHGIQSGFVEMGKVEKIKAYENEPIKPTIN